MQAFLQPAVSRDEPTRFVEMVFPDQANHYGTLFGGHALSLMGKAAFVAATRHVSDVEAWVRERLAAFQPGPGDG